MSKFQLGQRVQYHAYMHRCMHGMKGQWVRKTAPGEGTIAGKRTVSDGFADVDNWGEGNIYRATKYHSFWLVAPNLSGYRYVAEEDIVAVEVAQGGGVDGYHWEKTGGEDDDPKQG